MSICYRGIFAHEVGHVAPIAVSRLPFSIEGASSYAVGEAQASYTASQYLWVPADASEKLLLDALHRIATDGVWSKNSSGG